MGSAFGILNNTGKDMWYVLRSSDNTAAVVKIASGDNKIIRLSDTEIVTAMTYASEKEAEASIGIGERFKFEASSMK